jgi:cytochrome P450
MQSIELFLSLPAVAANPYPIYDDLRALGPIGDRGHWVLSSYADCRDALLDHDHLGQQEVGQAPPGLEPLFALQKHWMVLRNPPDHTRLRALVHRAFAPSVARSMQSAIERTTKAMIDAFPDEGEVDVMRSLARPLPVDVIVQMLGVPPSEGSWFKKLADDLVSGTSGSAGGDALARAARAAAEFSDYFRELAARRAAEPLEGDLVTRLVAERDGDSRLEVEEIVGVCTLLMFAGHETSSNLIGNGLLALLRHPEELDRLRRNPSLIDSAVEELLRFDSPVQMVSRFVRKEVSTRGFRMAEGDRVAVLIGAANHDPGRFQNPARLDLARGDNKHLSFGNGIHFCLGAALASLEGRSAIAALASLRSLRLSREPEFRAHHSLRGLSQLWIAYDK